MREFINEFRKFILRGNLLQVAVAFIIALYFVDVVNAFTNGIVLALVAAMVGKPSFGDITITINDALIQIGTFLNAVINFVLVAFVLFLIIKAYEHMLERIRRNPQADEAEPLSVEGELLTEIRDLLRARA